VRLTYHDSETIRITDIRDAMKARLEDCPRCGADHQVLGWMPFLMGHHLLVDGGEVGYWAECPLTQTPLLLWLKEVER